ncbi:MAG: SDR family NAD(P)-dependent oxidoreductase [Candidatus Marinimicrobia bacterium]|nr:SDR family NAD(P)-dependent oxidoreductase [Candidatus Neomarinimicrobiota bacterium]
MKKVLITGAAGFIGSHLAELCIESGYSVRALVHYNSRNTYGWLEDSKVINEIEIVSGDIRDYDGVYNAMQGVDTVFHLAALIGIPYSYFTPLAYIKTNVEGTYNVLQAARELDLGNVIITSTSETYGTAQYVPIDEKHPMVGQSPYSASKIAADQLAISYHRSFNLPVKLARPFNTYGPRQSARAVIPTIITQILSGKESIKLGNLAPTRDLTFVKDTARALIAISESDQLNGEVTNIGVGEEISIGELAGLICELMGRDIDIKEDSERVRPENSEVERLLSDNSKILKHTNWRPQYDLRKGLEETIGWLTTHLNIYKSEIYNI